MGKEIKIINWKVKSYLILLKGLKSEMEQRAIQQLISFSQDENEEEWSGQNVIKIRNQLDNVTSWASSSCYKNNFFIRPRKNNQQRKLSLCETKNKNKKIMNHTIRNSGLQENTNPSSIYYLDSNHSTFYKRYNCSNMDMTNPRVFLERSDRILSNVINLSKDLQMVHNQKKGKFVNFKRANKRIKTLY